MVNVYVFLKVQSVGFRMISLRNVAEIENNMSVFSIVYNQLQIEINVVLLP